MVDQNDNDRPAVRRSPAAAKARLKARPRKPVGDPSARAQDMTAMLLPVFLGEAEERLSSIEACLKTLADGPAPEVATELTHTVMRDAHSIKGGARTIGLKHVEEISRTFEAVAHRVKEGEIAPTAEVLSTFKDTVDALRSALTTPEKIEVGHVERVTAALKALDRGVEPEAAPEPVSVVPPLAVPDSLRAIWLTAAGQPLLIPTLDVDRVVRVRRDAVAEGEGGVMLAVGDDSLPFVYLDELLRLPRSEARSDSAHILVLLLDDGYRRLAVSADAIEDELEVAYSAEPGPDMIAVRRFARFVSGEIVPIADAASLLAAALGTAPEPEPVLESEEAGLPTPRAVLVAEDSATSRILLKEMLESAGYEVTTAIDGADAMSVLDHATVDLVLSDVEMPNMDGFQLTEQIRQHPKHRTLPVILVTGRERPQDRARGMAAGANGYFVKSRFDESELLSAIEQLL